MAEEDNSDVKEIDKSLDTNPLNMSEDGGSVGTVIVKNVLSEASEINEVVPKAKPQGVRRHSIGGKPEVQSRYRGDVRVSSTHDFCKHGGKRCDQDDVVKPWKIVRKKSVEGSVDSSLGLRRKPSTGSLSVQSLVTKPQSSVGAKRDVLAVGKKPWNSVNSEPSSYKGDSKVSRSLDGLSVKGNDKARKTRETESILRGSAVKKAPGLRNEKVPRISDGANAAKNLKNKEKGKAEVSGSDDMKEKTVCVVESSIKGVQSEKRPSSAKQTVRNGDKRLTTPIRSSRDSSPAKQILGGISTSLDKKKETGSVELEESPKSAKKIRPKKIGAKVELAKPVSFKKGKTLELKPEGSSPRWLKFRRRPVQEPKTPPEEKKKKLRETGINPETKTDSCEGSSGVKVDLKHRKVEGKKKMMTLFNNVIEETVNKLTKVRKTKVKALIGAFETVISLQDTKTSQKVQRKAATTSTSQVSPLNPQQ